MKALLYSSLTLLAFLLASCAHWDTITRSMTFADQPKIDVIDMAIDVAKELDFPPVTKVDKASGIVQFGAFGEPVLGLTAQVMVRPGNKVDVTVVRGSEYVALSAEQAADNFKKKLEERIKLAQTSK